MKMKELTSEKTQGFKNEFDPLQSSVGKVKTIKEAQLKQGGELASGGNGGSLALPPGNPPSRKCYWWHYEHQRKTRHFGHDNETEIHPPWKAYWG